MTRIEGIISTTHGNPSCVAAAVRVDNITGIATETAASKVTTRFSGTRLRSLIASADDYLMNLAVADEACRYGRSTGGRDNSSTGMDSNQRDEDEE